MKEKIYHIPVWWSCYGEVKISARNLEEAIQKAPLEELPHGEYIDSSFEVNEDCAREIYSNETIIKAYKVILFIAPDLQSARIDKSTFLSSKYRDLWPVTYKINEWVYPNVKISKLLTFKTLSHAKDFSIGIKHEQIFECLVLNPKISGPIQIPYPICIDRNALGEKGIDQVWKLYHNKKKYTHLSAPAPPGTLWCDAVKLTKQIK